MQFFSKIKHKGAIGSLFFASLFYCSCIQGVQYPPEPKIELIGYTYKDSLDNLGNPAHLGLITFSFTDGDGDIGLSESDTAMPYDYNLYVSRIGIQGGIKLTAEELNFRIPDITPSGQNKTLMGEIDVDLDIFPVLLSYDTLYYEVYIKDRKLNMSNTITTDYIVL
jgi:hypothetical protein